MIEVADIKVYVQKLNVDSVICSCFTLLLLSCFFHHWISSHNHSSAHATGHIGSYIPFESELSKNSAYDFWLRLSLYFKQFWKWKAPNGFQVFQASKQAHKIRDIILVEIIALFRLTNFDLKSLRVFSS